MKNSMYAARRRQKSVHRKLNLRKLRIGQQLQLFDNALITPYYFRSNRTMTSRYHRYGTMFQIIHSSIRM